ncbi:MAG: Maf family protein, partial [Gammaproteobacteria bacterium]
TANRELSALSSSEVEFAQLTGSQINAYVATGEPMDKAGAYAIQGLAARFVVNLNGSYSGVMGLPVYETANLLSACGVRSRI